MSSPLVKPPIRATVDGRRTSQPPSPPVPTERVRLLDRFAAEMSAFIHDAEPRRIAWETMRLLPQFAFPCTRARLLSLVGCRVEPSVSVLGYVHLVGPRDAAKGLQIGRGSVIGPQVTFCLDASITIGKNVSIGPRAMLYTATHSLGTASRRMHLSVAARPISIEDGVWIGLGAVILGGVRVGRGSVIAAASVVKDDVPEDVLIAGNPASIVQRLPDSVAP